LAASSPPEASRTYTTFRVVRAGVDPLSTSGSRAAGGRYNHPGIAGVLYSSLNKATAIAEVMRGLRIRGVDPKHFGPQDWWIYEIRVQVSSLVDLRNDAARSDLGVTAEALVGDDPAETRRIGNYARENGFQAVLAPSAAAKDQNNLVVFMDRLRAHPEVISSTPVNLSAV
jgi:RES domain-containing protein